MTASQPIDAVPAYRGDGHLERVLRSGAFAVTAEVTPPLSSSPGDLLDKALPLRGLVPALGAARAVADALGTGRGAEGAGWASETPSVLVARVAKVQLKPACHFARGPARIVAPAIIIAQEIDPWS